MSDENVTRIQTGPQGGSYIVKGDMPGLEEIRHRIETAGRTMKLRGIQPAPFPLMTSWQVQALKNLLIAKGVIANDDEFAYWIGLTQMEDLERLLVDAAKQQVAVPQIVRPS